MITDIEDYFSKGCGRCDRFGTDACSARVWSAGLTALREVCRSAGLEETVRWGQPCYRHAGRNIALIGSFRESFVLGFFNAALMKDPEAVLRKQGPNTRHADTLRFSGADEGAGEVKTLAPVILSYLLEAKDYAAKGLRPVRQADALDLPGELIDALDDDPELAEAFQGLTPGRQRSYVINLAGAKTADTRRNRIARFRPKILAGKGANEY